MTFGRFTKDLATATRLLLATGKGRRKIDRAVGHAEIVYWFERTIPGGTARFAGKLQRSLHIFYCG